MFSFLERELIHIFKNYLMPAVWGIIIGLIFNRFFCVVIVDGLSMNPTLQDGQILVGYKQYKGKLAPGDVVVARITRFDTGEEEIIIKRVIATEGQVIKIRDGQVFVDDVELEEDYIKEKMHSSQSLEVVVPEGEVFVMGDNRNNSLDSRIQGTISLEDILMKIL